LENKKLKIKTQNDKLKFKNDTTCHCEKGSSLFLVICISIFVFVSYFGTRILA